MPTELHLQSLIPQDWRHLLSETINSPSFAALENFLAAEYAQAIVYPPREQLFAALEHTPFKEVKVVLLGQDPYHGPGQAHGLSFSVQPGVKLPPSLRNMYKELQSDLGLKPPSNGDLRPWADQGVLLLNTVMSVRAGAAGSHRKHGWEVFTDAVIRAVNQHKEHVIFVLWGKDAQKKAPLIDTHKHLVIEGVHPSPLSAHNGFFGSKPFSAINQALLKWGKEPVQWSPGQG